MEMLMLCLHSILFFIFLVSLNNINISSAETIYNVQTYGAKPNGKTDSTQAFLDAWAAACGSADPTIIYIPEGRYLLGSVAFTGGNCKSPDISVRIDGTLIAPEDYRILGLASNWLSFEGVSGVSIVGGALDAKGSPLWDCKSKGSNCPAGATVLHCSNYYNSQRI